MHPLLDWVSVCPGGQGLQASHRHKRGVRGRDGGLGSPSGDSQAEHTVELLTRPNNPDGRLQHPSKKFKHLPLLVDSVFLWPSYLNASDVVPRIVPTLRSTPCPSWCVPTQPCLARCCH